MMTANIISLVVILSILVVVQFFRNAIRFQKLTRTLVLKLMTDQWKYQEDLIQESVCVLDDVTTTACKDFLSISNDLRKEFDVLSSRL